jgi:hypothetical protein
LGESAVTDERLVEWAAREGRPVLINRNRGSGTRLLFDMCLRSCAQAWAIPIEKLTESLRGYDSEAKSHNAVAASIALRKADWGLAIDTVAHDYLVIERPAGSPVLVPAVEALVTLDRDRVVVQAIPGLIEPDEAT